ncbi:3-ketosteroid-9-alpha-hydroxylase [Mycolicibacterium duvalii]|uniref:3-ketosteroid-9-alpha-hydroxylase reductase subunit n=1 Tax=Mycolicibacterium duvalii TaxID=39688 RepID=A0A7I7K2E7_9MYCO|nr:ferredoxin--NADP reductase [Mycolicibacterium duvalii]MCV7366586.1 ferredoxin--NADP reductase [Mycolicibacterium duvalii]PEG41623.1 3-ketosteroid-9-alpha-hydroxylase [Mycolicibacterium duvalii]BBX17804.1 3-ketosteroid-9-alpha-hydroxylase reductase subunit [Mycolicibacterium duvalii]
MSDAPRAVPLTVTDVLDEGPDAKSLVFSVPAEHRDRFGYRPGQFLTLRIPSERTGAVARCYSLASSPHTDTAPKVTVKRTDGGYGSNWLCDNVSAGDVIEALPPSGAFTPRDLDSDHLLWAAGSGITPVMSILKSVLAAGTGRVVLCYANRDEASVIFAAELRDLAARYAGRLTVLHWLESVQGLPTGVQLSHFSRLFGGYQSYICGPAPFMAVVRETLIDSGVPRENIHLEVFQSLEGDPFTAPATDAGPDDGEAADAEVLIDGERHHLRWPVDRNLVDTMLAAGIEVPYSCREGNCGSCAATVVEGEVDPGNAAILEADDIAEGLILACQARPRSDSVTVEF